MFWTNCDKLPCQRHFFFLIWGLWSNRRFRILAGATQHPNNGMRWKGRKCVTVWSSGNFHGPNLDGFNPERLDNYFSSRKINHFPHSGFCVFVMFWSFPTHEDEWFLVEDCFQSALGGVFGWGYCMYRIFLFGMYSEIEEEEQFFELHDPTSISCRMKYFSVLSHLIGHHCMIFFVLLNIGWSWSLNFDPLQKS